MISGTQIQELIENDGYPAMFETYERETPLYPQVAEVVSVGDAGAPLYGDKGAVFQNVDRFQPIEDGADPEDSTLDKGWTWQAAIKRYSRRIRIPATVLAANNLPLKIDLGITASGFSFFRTDHDGRILACWNGLVALHFGKINFRHYASL